MLLLMILMAAVLYAVFAFLVSKASGRADPFAANAIFNGLGGLLPLAAYGLVKARNNEASTTKEGIIYSLLAGVCIAIFSVMLVKIFARGGNLAYVMPLVYGVSIILGAALGYFFLKEQVSGLQLAGLGVTAIGIGMVVVSKL